MDDAETAVQPNRSRRVQKSKRRANAFGPKRRAIFLRELAASCNYSAAALAAGINRTTAYAARARDPEFAAECAAAMEVGYARLEAALLRAAIASVDSQARAEAQAERAIFDAPEPQVAPMDATTALRVLQSYRVHGHKAPGDVRPRRSDIADARARLEKKMRALRLIDAEGNAITELRPNTAEAQPALAAPCDGAR